MEPIGATSEGECSCLNGMNTTEEADFMAQLLGNFTLPSQPDTSSSLEVPISASWPSHGSTVNVAGANQDSFHPSEITITDFYMFSQRSAAYNTYSSILFPITNQQSRNSSICHNILGDNNSSMSMNLSVEDTASYLVGGDFCLNKEMKNDNVEVINQHDPEAALPENSLQLQTESNMPAVSEPTAKDQSHSSMHSRKRQRNSGDAQKKKRSVWTKKSQSSASNNDEESNARLNGRISSSCCSEDDSNASHELSGGASSSLSPKEAPAFNLDGKARAGREAATDHQSLYARKRRERINERLRILQNLVPNGTKVDISTMLEEAVHYVKFLQLQIKLLSSDDLWMYAPIAYNGMNIGLDLKVTPTAR